MFLKKEMLLKKVYINYISRKYVSPRLFYKLMLLMYPHTLKRMKLHHYADCGP